MEQTNDGFKIADEDLIVRGPGDYVGYRQSGFVKYKIANMITDGAIIRKARVLAAELIKEDPLLDNHSKLKERVLNAYKNNLNLVNLN